MSREYSHSAIEVIARLKDCFELSNDYELADMLGIAQSTLASWKSRNIVDETLIIAKCKDISLEWIFRGRGPVNFQDFINTLKTDIKDIGGRPDYTLRPIHDQIGAGNLVFFQELEPTENTFVPTVLVELYPEMYYFRVEGWSMFPTVLPGAIIGINTAEKNIVSGEMYGIWYEHEGASIKYLFAQPDKFIIKADNPKYPESEITVEELEFNDRFIIGRMRYLSQIYK